MKIAAQMLLAGLALTASRPGLTKALPQSHYIISKSVALGAPDRWDYVVFDPEFRRVYVAHSDKVEVVDSASGRLIGRIEGITGGTHGTAISSATGQGFTDDGRSGKVVVFNLQTLKVTRQIQSDVDADAIALDRLTGHAFVIEGDPAAITVIDPKTDKAIATIKAGEKLEYAVADGAGRIYVAGEEKGDLLKIDARSNKVVAQWPAPGCTSPHGLAIDRKHHRLFMGCSNTTLMVMDADNGRVISKLPIGRGSDAVAFDANRGRVFSSNGADGTISVYQQSPRDQYSLLETIKTAVSGRTMDVDPKSGRLFLAAAETDPNLVPGSRPKVRPGSLKLLIIDPQ